MHHIPNPTLHLLNRKIAFSTLIQYAGKALQLVISALALKMISNFLTASGYSLYATITEYALFFSTLGNLGIFGNLIRLMADEPDNGKIFTHTLQLRLLSGALIWGLGIFILYLLNSDPLFILGTAIFLGALIFEYVTSVCDAMLQANYLMGRATLALVIGRLINLLLLSATIHFLPAASFLLSLSLILLSTFTGSLTTALLSIFFVRQKVSFEWEWRPAYLLKLFLMGLPFGIINLVYSLYTRFLPDFFAHSTLNEQAFASFNISFRIAQVLSLASTFLMFSVLPGFKQYIDQKHWQKAFTLYKRVFWLILLGGLLVFVFGSLLGPFVISLLTHQKYLLSQFWFVLPMMLLISAVSYCYDQVLITLFAFNDEIWFLKQEFIALLLASLISILTDLSALLDTEKIVLILAAALLAEIYIVTVGYFRVNQHFKKNLVNI